MKLEFDSVEDLNDFLRWATLYPAPGVAPASAGGSVSLTFPEIDAPAAELPAFGLPADVAFDTPPTGDAQAPANMPPAEPQKRKRRTKAEIEADEKAAKGARTGEIPPQGPAPAATNAGGSVDVARVVNADGTVTTTSVGLPPDVKPEEVTARPQGANPFAQSEVVDNTVSTPEVVAGGEGDPAEAVVTPFQHLTRARDFIAKHGMPKYNETFAKAGLDANVMAYSAYQRGVHMATMDEFDKA